MPEILRCYKCKATWVQRGPTTPLRCPRCQCRSWWDPIKHGHHPQPQQPEPPEQIPTDTDPGPLPNREDA